MSALAAAEVEQIRNEHERALEGLLQISHAVGSVMELPDILRRIVAETADVMGADVCSVFLNDDGGKHFRLRASHGLNPDIVDKAVFALGEGIVGWTAQTRQIVALSDAARDPRFKPMLGSGEERLHAYVCAPLLIRQELIGVMTARWSQARHFDPTEITLFETICKQVSIVIEKARLYHEKMGAERLAAIAVGLSEIAHYAKNLLQAIEGGSFVVEKGLASKDLEQVGKGWGLLRRNTKKITDLVQNMLSYSREEPPDFTPENVNDLLRDVVESARSRAERAEVQLVESYDPSVPECLVDPDYLHDSFLNLVTNAIDAIPESGGVVVVRTRFIEQEGQIQVEVKDNGAGIPAENHAKIFNLFFTTKGSKGSGIGLAATKKRIEAHNGTIGFESEPGKGTTFRARIPVARSVEVVPKSEGG